MPIALALIRAEQKTCDLEIYFHRPIELEGLKFQELFRIWNYSYVLPATELAYELEGLNLKRGKTMYLFQRKDTNRIVRLNSVSPNAGVIFFLRLIIRSIPVRNFVDILTVRGRLYDSFQEAAHARGLVQDANEVVSTFQESMALNASSRELRTLFITLTLHGFPTILIYNNAACRYQMLCDYIFQPPQVSHLEAENLMLRDLQQRLLSENRTMVEFGLPEPRNDETMLQREQLLQNAEFHQQLLNELNAAYPNTPEMQMAYDYIETELNANRGGMWFHC
jgi:hypothetical protein